jgi:hypothetical protein
LEQAKLSKRSYTKWLEASMDEELTTEELMDLRVISFALWQTRKTIRKYHA